MYILEPVRIIDQFARGLAYPTGGNRSLRHVPRWRMARRQRLAIKIQVIGPLAPVLSNVTFSDETITKIDDQKYCLPTTCSRLQCAISQR